MGLALERGRGGVLDAEGGGISAAEHLIEARVGTFHIPQMAHRSL